MKHRYLLLLAAPAMAGLLFTAGCDEDDDVGRTTPTTPDTTARQDTTPADTTTPRADEGTPAGARMGGAGEVADQQVEQLTQRIEQLRDRVQQAGEAAPESNMFSQRLDALRGAVQNRNWERVAQTVGEIRALQVPADYRQDFDAIVDQLRQLNVPALQNLGGGAELPTVPGVPEPGETPPNGGA